MPADRSHPSGPSPWLLRLGLPLLVLLGILALHSYRGTHAPYAKGEEGFVARVWHWERLRMGMTQDNVTALLGPNHATDPAGGTSSRDPLLRVRERWVYSVPEEDEPDPEETYYWMVYFGHDAADFRAPQHAWRVVDFEMIRAPDPIILY